nr:cysteine-rich receptor-like protein kinase 2 [Ipomoea batatas]
MKEIVLSAPMSYVALIVLVMITLFIPVSNGASRSDTIKRICGNQLMNNATAYIQTFVAATDNVNQQIVTQGWGISSAGTGPDSNYELAQCYGDLSSLDCVECFTEARTLIGQCFPYNGGRIYLDGCFMRGENYSFFQEVLGAEDMDVCGNDTRKDLLFQETARRAVLQAVSNAPNSNGYARVEMLVSGAQNESSAYVLANCWKTLNASACKTCLENASNSMLKCLPWSEGRALYTGCFMRYSDHDFLNPIPTKEDSSGRGNVVVIVVTTVSSVVVLVLALVIGFYIWKRRRIAIKRRGSNDAENLVNTLHDISLSFKYSTLEKATESFNEANKLGQGGFGSVYKVWKHFQEERVDELFDPNLILNNYRNIDVKNEALRAVHVGLLCTQEVASLRPPMSKALQMLLKKEELPLPTNPPFMNDKIMQLNSDWDSPTFPLREGDSASIASMFHSSFYPR